MFYTQMRRVQKRLREIHLFGQKGIESKKKEKIQNEPDLSSQYRGDNYGSLFGDTFT